MDVLEDPFPAGAVRSGHLIVEDGEPEVLQACTLRSDGRGGVSAEVPYVIGAAQFAIVERWFRKQELPARLVFIDADGFVSLAGVHYAGGATGPRALGRFRADEVVFAQPTTLIPSDAGTEFAHVRSRIDALDDFARFRPVTMDSERTPAGLRTVVTIETTAGVEWDHGGFHYSIDAEAPYEAMGSTDFTVASVAYLHTESAQKASTADHLAAQWPVRALLVLLNGAPLRWVGHDVRDDSFPTFMLDGHLETPTWVPALLRRTARDRTRPEPQRREVALPILHLAQVGADGMRRWVQRYDDPAFNRAIAPIVEVTADGTGFLEVQVMMSALALDAMGHFHDGTRKPNQPIADQIGRSLTFSCLDWSDIGSDVGITKFLAKTNNDLKHPDRPGKPDGLRLSLAAALSLTIMRAQVIPLLGLADDLQASFSRTGAFQAVHRSFELNGVTINDAGLLIPR